MLYNYPGPDIRYLPSVAKFRTDNWASNKSGFLEVQAVTMAGCWGLGFTGQKRKVLQMSCENLKDAIPQIVGMLPRPLLYGLFPPYYQGAADERSFYMQISEKDSRQQVKSVNFKC